MKKKILLIAIICITLTLLACTNTEDNSLNALSENHDDDISEPVDAVVIIEEISHGKIYLYGEAHGVKKILDSEIEIWGDYYMNDNMRHLFIESPYYTAEFLNIWMHSETDDILDDIYNDWSGTQAHNPHMKDFYKTIKEKYPETIFHGTDVGHQYHSTGQRYLDHLSEHGLKDSDNYKIAKEVMKQGEMFTNNRSSSYRENMMVENFTRAFNSLDSEDIMGIYGSAHTDFESLDFSNSIPCMANQLKELYEEIYSVNLTYLAKDIDPIREDSVVIENITFKASYYGKVERNGMKNIDYIDFWRIEDAYETFNSHELNGNVLPFNNFPMTMSIGQVYMIDVYSTDGSSERSYYRSDGNTWNDRETTEEFLLEIAE